MLIGHRLQHVHAVFNVDSLATCGDDGLVASAEACTAGCVSTPVAHCTHVVPRYMPTACDLAAVDSQLTVSNTATFDTNLDSNCNGGIVSQVAAPSICVVHYGTISIASGFGLKVTGNRVLAMIADRDLSIAGMLDVSADANTNGPGGGATLSGASVFQSAGGGGAGFHTAGAPGGSPTADGGGGAGGILGINPATLAVIQGGPQSGDTVNGVKSGGGGGGVTLVSCHGTVDVSGLIDAGGGGASRVLVPGKPGRRDGWWRRGLCGHSEPRRSDQW